MKALTYRLALGTFAMSLSGSLPPYESPRRRANEEVVSRDYHCGTTPNDVRLLGWLGSIKKGGMVYECP